ncbi:Hydroperoxide isomerase ALOXE3 [Merluccius polli]|uniref:Hydroperoxide isomerase ALOXE3 n=1 Tax=Merluccius polli TaxID=89951 RepID=A0AA47N7H6_MERPO|nr:Hydroperoxide isomerase ALOXE3 [Merluccius polli]
MPQELGKVDDLVKFVTMVIFTGSAQHAAVNNGQFDYGSWMPNMPTTIDHPPPDSKGRLNDSGMVNALPDINTTVHGMALLLVLSDQSSDFVPLGHYPEEHFSEEKPCEHMETFKRELSHLSKIINGRNGLLKVPYTFMDPLHALVVGRCGAWPVELGTYETHLIFIITSTSYLWMVLVVPVLILNRGHASCAETIRAEKHPVSIRVPRRPIRKDAKLGVSPRDYPDFPPPPTTDHVMGTKEMKLMNESVNEAVRS